jgi:hypothetical protein
MVFIKDPEWYYKDQSNKDKIYSNIIFIILGIYHYYRKNYVLSSLFTLLFLGSSMFHLYTNKNTLLLDRLGMILIFSKLFNIFYPNISFSIFSIIGIVTLAIWYKKEELLPYFLFQLMGLFLFILYYPMDIYYKLIISIMYILITYSQMITSGKYHSLKHIGLGLLSLFIV